MGTKIPFRFPLIDQMVPTVTMFDVSRLVSAPVEPRALASAFIRLTGAPGVNAVAIRFHCLASGGVFIEFLSLETNATGGINLPSWDLDVQPTTGLLAGSLLDQVKVDVGGEPTRSNLVGQARPWNSPFNSASTHLPQTINFGAQPRFFIPAGSFLLVQGPIGVAGDDYKFTIAWSELPASFEEA
jgi:hypothetical protein